MKRKHISWKTKCAAAVLDGLLARERFGLDPRSWYRDAKKMTEDQFLSLFEWNHNILHETGHPERDLYWNLEPMRIRQHAEQTKHDATIIAKGRRIRKKLMTLGEAIADPTVQVWTPLPKRKIRSRGFDKTRRRKMSGKVVPR